MCVKVITLNEKRTISLKTLSVRNDFSHKHNIRKILGFPGKTKGKGDNDSRPECG